MIKSGHSYLNEISELQQKLAIRDMYIVNLCEKIDELMEHVSASVPEDLMDECEILLEHFGYKESVSDVCAKRMG